jgi:uncharacterized protein
MDRTDIAPLPDLAGLPASSAIMAKQSEIAALCRLNQVARLDLFGSATRPTFDAQTSDFDFLVEFATDTPEGAADRFFGLKHGLSALLGRTVDLVDLAAAKNPYFLQAIALPSMDIEVQRYLYDI